MCGFVCDHNEQVAKLCHELKSLKTIKVGLWRPRSRHRHTKVCICYNLPCRLYSATKFKLYFNLTTQSISSPTVVSVILKPELGCRSSITIDIHYISIFISSWYSRNHGGTAIWAWSSLVTPWPWPLTNGLEHYFNPELLIHQLTKYRPCNLFLEKPQAKLNIKAILKASMWCHRWRHECVTHNLHNYAYPLIYFHCIVCVATVLPG